MEFIPQWLVSVHDHIGEVGMVKELAFRSGICLRCFRSGVVREGDVITLISASPLDLI
jgi:hypothetical protein